MMGTNNDKQLSRIILKGFKSIAECDLKLSRLNVLIGANGAGKSNFIGFFRMVQQLLEQNLQVFVSRQGSPDALLHFGRKTTEQLEFQLYFGNNGYFATLEPTHDNRLMFTKESFWWNMSGEHEIGKGHFETLALSATGTRIDSYVVPTIQRWRVYHFHDTSDSAYVKQPHGINDNAYLRTDGRNLASFLYLLRDRYRESY
ncbi:MAG: AAA family ATPase [Rhizonema sp. PD38]|nr:AAA family ATPase [Rhizonema sp. PD38]